MTLSSTYCCPTCSEPLASSESILNCRNGHEFRIVNEIPRFVPAEDNYATSFGLQWNRFRKTQLDSFSGLTISRDRMVRCLGPKACDMIKHNGPKIRVLEVGCGAGRFSEVLLKLGAHVTSVDLSNAVEANQENFPQGPLHRIAQADLRRLPFASREFDIVVCLGVLQHTPSPEISISALYEQVRPGGVLVIDNYMHTLSGYFSLKPFWRQVFLKIDHESAIHITERLVSLLLPLHAQISPIPVLRSVLGRLSPVHHFYGLLPLSDTLHKEWSVLDTHDSLTDVHKNRRTPQQIRETLERLGTKEVWCEPGGIGVEARGWRPE